MKTCMVFLVAAIVAGAFAVSQAQGPGNPPAAKPNQYIGVEKCKNCHIAKATGNQYEHWTKTKHAGAFDALATQAAKDIAKARGIADPQKDDACLKCHTTAFGEPAARLRKGFDPKNVQCEVCHGPGGQHFDDRMAEKPMGANEIVAAPDADLCKKCHNKESPSFKPFCFKHRAEQIRHLNPEKGRTKEEREAMKCQGGCGVEHE